MYTRHARDFYFELLLTTHLCPTCGEKMRVNGSGPRQKSVSGTATKKSTSSASNNPGPKFVPVGFYPRHLSLLDDAVLKLRRSGHWRASKSAIIRNLIEAHAEDLERFGRNDE